MSMNLKKDILDAVTGNSRSVCRKGTVKFSDPIVECSKCRSSKGIVIPNHVRSSKSSRITKED